MIYWIILGLFLLVMGIVCNIPSKRILMPERLKNFGRMLIALGITCFILSIVLSLNYMNWEQSFALMAETFSEAELEGKYYYVWDVASANNELFDFQALYLRYGEWSCVPASVMDIKPIG